jgi:type IV pilus assembly protein PilW
MKHYQLAFAVRKKSLGLTLVELLISLVLSSMVTLVALALFTSSAATYRTTDASQELQDNARFIAEIFSKAIRHGGLQDNAQYSAFQTRDQATLTPSYLWDSSFGSQAPLFGANNAKITNVGSATDFGTDGNGGYNNSDVFGVRYFGSSLLSNVAAADGSVIDCRGIAVPFPLAQSDVGLSLFQVAVGASGEPELQCINGGRTAQPIVMGVESLQIAYGIDTDPATDTSPNQWLDASEVTTAALWSRVRIVRLGVVLRGAPGSANGAQNLNAIYPLGDKFSEVAGALPTTAGNLFTPPNDNRLRKAFNFNISVRNSLEQ